MSSSRVRPSLSPESIEVIAEPQSLHDLIASGRSLAPSEFRELLEEIVRCGESRASRRQSSDA